MRRGDHAHEASWILSLRRSARCKRGWRRMFCWFVSPPCTAYLLCRHTSGTEHFYIIISETFRCKADRPCTYVASRHNSRATQRSSCRSLRIGSDPTRKLPNSLLYVQQAALGLVQARRPFSPFATCMMQKDQRVYSRKI